MKADYIIRGGRVIDPAAHTDQVKDVAVRNTRIIDSEQEAIECDHIIDATDCIVVPGLIDFHTHIFYEGSTFCIHPDMMIAQGTTTAVDAGSSGTATYEAFYKSVITQSQVRIKSFVTPYSGGQLDPGLCEDFNPKLYNMDKIERLIDKYRENILGFKIRFSKGVIPEGTGADYLKAVVEMADMLNDRLKTNLRVYVHTTNSPVTAGQLADCLRPGDIFGHCYQGAGNTIVMDDGAIDPDILRARERGVIFDAANGKGNFDLECAQKALAAGFLPDIISSDLTVDKFNMPPYAKSLPLVLSKYLAMGMKLTDIIERAAANPARIMGMDGQIGTLQPGACADIAVFKAKKNKVIHKDFRNKELEGNVILVPQLTMCAGEIQYCQADFYN